MGKGIPSSEFLRRVMEDSDDEFSSYDSYECQLKKNHLLIGFILRWDNANASTCLYPMRDNTKGLNLSLPSKGLHKRLQLFYTQQGITQNASTW